MLFRSYELLEGVCTLCAYAVRALYLCGNGGAVGDKVHQEMPPYCPVQYCTALYWIFSNLTIFEIFNLNRLLILSSSQPHIDPHMWLFEESWCRFREVVPKNKCQNKYCGPALHRKYAHLHYDRDWVAAKKPRTIEKPRIRFIRVLTVLFETNEAIFFSNLHPWRFETHYASSRRMQLRRAVLN